MATVTDPRPEERIEPVTDGGNPYLHGIHSPMTEELTLEQLPVEGEIPAGLNGQYMRIGPNPLIPVDEAKHHWFTGDGMVHGIRIENGQALWYRNRWLRSTAVSEALGEAPAPGTRSPMSDTVNTNVIGHAGKIFGVVEAGGFPVELSPELETVRHTDFEGTLEKAFSAHPHRDPATGELHAICYLAPEIDTVRHVVVGTDGKVRRAEPIAVEHGPSIHDCAITENFVVVMDLPVTFSLDAMSKGYRFPYRWNPAHKARIGLLPREGKGDAIVWHDIDPCYAFHPCNAYEREDGAVVMDIVVHDKLCDESYFGPDGSKTAFERWIIPADGGKVERSVADASGQEFPRFDERLTGRPYRYAYCTALADGGAGFISETRLYKHDRETGTREVHDFGANRHPGEFVFVPDGPGELDGHLMGLVVDMNDETTDLILIDPANFEGEAVAKIRLPHRVPPGFHGNWVNASELV